MISLLLGIVFLFCLTWTVLSMVWLFGQWRRGR